jgi:hypothetical protein
MMEAHQLRHPPSPVKPSQKVTGALIVETLEKVTLHIEG